MQTHHRAEEFTTIVPPFGSDSPKRRTLKFVNSSPNRRSAGARLCKVFEEDVLSFSDGETDLKVFESGSPSNIGLTGLKSL